MFSGSQQLASAAGVLPGWLALSLVFLAALPPVQAMNNINPLMCAQCDNTGWEHSDLTSSTAFFCAKRTGEMLETQNGGRRTKLAHMLRLRGGAEVGKGDPRWIVTERADGKNVGSWHWEERNMMQWSRQRIDEMVGIAAQMDHFDGRFSGAMSVVNVTRVTGDAVIHQRKGKLWPLCDMQITLSIAEGSPEVPFTGSVSFPEVTMDDQDNLEMTVTVNGAGAEREAMGRWLRKEGGGAVRGAVVRFLEDLQAKASSGQGSVSAAVSVAAAKDLEKVKEAAAKMAQVNKQYQEKQAAEEAGAGAGAGAGEGGGLSGSVSVMEEFAARTVDLFDALTNSNKVAAYTRCSDTLLEPRQGGRIAWFNGHITGGIEQYHPPEYLQMRLRMASWPAGHFSTVKYLPAGPLALDRGQIFVKDNGAHQGCRLELQQEGVPQSRVQETETFWKEKVLNQIKLSFGYGPVTNSAKQLFSGI